MTKLHRKEPFDLTGVSVVIRRVGLISRTRTDCILGRLEAG